MLQPSPSAYHYAKLAGT